jgi:Family of unknown function (DUF5995)
MTTTAPAASPGLPGVDRVLARMRALDEELPGGDGVAVFNRVYLSVTEELRHRIAAGGFGPPGAGGADNPAVLAAVFAGRYLTAVADDAAGREAPACWRPLLRMRRHRGIRPLQFALAGINAHVGHDLALAVVDACRALGIEPPALERDFDRVGELLTSVEERIREELMPGPDLLDVADPLTHLAGSWSLERARDAAWAASRVLWSLRDLPELYGMCAGQLDGGVGLVGRFLLTPLGRSSSAGPHGPQPKAFTAW